MISVYKTKLFCNEDVSLIENYDKAINDKEHIWECHHKLEIRDDYINTVKDLKLMNLYYNRPACELIFLTNKEHCSIHSKSRKGRIIHKPEYFIKRSLCMKGKKPWNYNNPVSEFGKLFTQHFGISSNKDKTLYAKEKRYYVRNNKCSLE